MQGEAISLNGIGHTDATGLEDSNLKLYKASAAVLKDALVSICEISANRLKTDGKGKAEPQRNHKKRTVKDKIAVFNL
jgi:outer membrane protein OmpA-like peptidoglycan-associated protein